VTRSPIQRGASVRNRLPAGWSEGAHADRHARDIRLVTLGDFSVSACGVPVTLGHHQARVLLAILVCQTGPVHREKLLEWMWPHLSVDRALSTLYSTVYTLRRRLEPGRTGASSASFIRSDGEAYNLDWQRDDFLDATEFLRLSRIAGQPADGETRLRRLANAEAAYSGPFLPQWPYEEWAAVRRSEVEETYRRSPAIWRQRSLKRVRPLPQSRCIGACWRSTLNVSHGTGRSWRSSLPKGSARWPCISLSCVGGPWLCGSGSGQARKPKRSARRYPHLPHGSSQVGWQMRLSSRVGYRGGTGLNGNHDRSRATRREQHAASETR